MKNRYKFRHDKIHLEVVNIFRYFCPWYDFTHIMEFTRSVSLFNEKTTPENFILMLSSQMGIHLKSGKSTCFLNKIETFFGQLYYLHEFVCCTVVLKTEILCTKINWKFLCRNSQHRNEKQFCDMLFVRKRVIQISIG